MNENQTMAMMVLLFLAVQVIGLSTALQYQSQVEEGLFEEIEESSDVSFVFILFAYILFVTVVIIIIIKYIKKFLVFIEAMAILFTSYIIFGTWFPYIIIGWVDLGLVFAFGLMLFKMAKPSILTQNLALMFSVSGAGAFLGMSLTVLPVMFFMLILSLYDFISVFYTKHMVYLAKAVSERPTAFTAAFPTKGNATGKEKAKYNHIYQLGGGDLVIPLMFSVTVLFNYGLVNALAVIFGSLIALLLLFNYIMKRPGNALPALPPICAGACLAFVLSLLI